MHFLADRSLLFWESRLKSHEERCLEIPCKQLRHSEQQRAQNRNCDRSAEMSSALWPRDFRRELDATGGLRFEFQRGASDEGAEIYGCVARCRKAYVALIIDTVSFG